LGAGKSATVLIDYLIQQQRRINGNLSLPMPIKSRFCETNHSPFAEAVALDVTNEDQRSKLIQRAHVVISMMPPSLHFLVAKDCVEYRSICSLLLIWIIKLKAWSGNKTQEIVFLCEMVLTPALTT